MRARAHAAVSYIDDATMPHVGHAGSFKILGAIRHFCTCVVLDPGSVSHAVAEP